MNGRQPISTGDAPEDVNTHANAQGFTTGDDPDGYDLTGVSLLFESGIGDRNDVSVSLWASNSPRPSEMIVEFENPETIDAGWVPFRAPRRVRLEASTTYFVVVEKTDGAAPAVNLSTTTSNGEDPDSTSGWGVSDFRLTRPLDRTGPWTQPEVAEQAELLMINVRGFERAPPPTPTPSGPAFSRVLRIEPAVREVTMRSGQVVRLEIKVYGRQDLPDQSLVNPGDVDWSTDGDGSLKGPGGPQTNGADGDVSVLYVAPETPGRNKVVASVLDCLGKRVGESDESASARCTAEFWIVVLRSARSVVLPTPVPVNPPGPIPVVIPGADGTQHSVFTPEEGGDAESPDGACTLRAPVGAVANGELIGVSLQTGDVEALDGRYATGDVSCSISAVDSDGDAIASYVLEDPAEVCIPVPPPFRSRIVDVQMASISDGVVKTVFGGTIRIVGNSGEIELCGEVSELPATVSALLPIGLLPPEALVTPAPSPVSPDTGGYGPRSTAAFVLLLLLAGAVVAMAVFVTLGIRRAPRRE